jgi:vitamin B12 transporter
MLRPSTQRLPNPSVVPLIGFAFALLQLAGVQPTAAQDTPDAGVSQQDAATPQPKAAPPTLVYAPEPPFPEEASAAGLTQATVALRVLIDIAGQVSEAEVIEPAGHGFDEAAHQAALAYRFEPARRDGEPVAARIMLRIAFQAPQPPAAEPALAPEPPAVIAPPPPPPTAAPSTEASGVDVTVRGHSQSERLRRSAEAVQVVDTTEAKRRTADLGEVLARTQGVGVQRAGGLGSNTRFSLNGLTDDQVRFFLDEMPLDFAGYPFGIANIPINLVERVEIYRGVVPIRFGADALGGAVNVVSNQNLRGTHASASLQAGSFGTYLATLSAQHLDEKSGWFNRVTGFLDRADNNYPMNVQVADARGRETTARVYRFHDGYRAEGVNLESGIIDKPWAKRLLLRGFLTHYEKDIQHNLLMTFNPYGDIILSQLTGGGTLRYENTLAERFFVEAVLGYSFGTMHYTDVGKCVYDWFGQCVRERPQPGERNGRAEDQYYSDHNAYGRINLDYRLHPEHQLRLSVAPTYMGRGGEERRLANRDARDPLSAERDVVSIVSGLEYKANLADKRLENVLFVKDYLQILRSEDPVSNSDTFRRRDRETHRFGIGDALRYSFADWIYAKASYEWATRLPRPDEIFGNAFPIQANLELKPEISHNFNLGVTVNAPLGHGSQLRADVNGFVRDADQLIVLVGNDKTAMYQNVYSARSAGAEVAAGWTSPGEYLALDGNFTYVDFRNTSDTGPFEANKGDRIPNRPYLFGNGSARLQVRQLASPQDELALLWSTRYVHDFYRGWEGLGTDKLGVDAQLLHSLALTYVVKSDAATLSFTCEVQNLTDQAAYDFFGVPRPGRAFYFKAMASL